MTLIQALALGAPVCALVVVFLLYAIERHRHAKARMALEAMTSHAQRAVDSHEKTIDRYLALEAEHRRWTDRDERGRFVKRKA